MGDFGMTRRWILAAGVMTALGCGTDAVGPGANSDGLTVQVVDSGGVGLGEVPVEAFGQTTGGTPFDWIGATDPDGWALRGDTIPAAIGSLRISVGGGGACPAFAAFDTTVAPWRSADGARIVGRRMPAATLAPGKFCGTGHDATDGDFVVHLAIDSIADSVWGRFEVDYALTRASDLGPFTGTVTQGQLVLDLRSEVAIPGCLSHYLATAHLDAAGAIGPARLAPLPGSCLIYDEPFQLVVYEGQAF